MKTFWTIWGWAFLLLNVYCSVSGFVIGNYVQATFSGLAALIMVYYVYKDYVKNRALAAKNR